MWVHHIRNIVSVSGGVTSCLCLHLVWSRALMCRTFAQLYSPIHIVLVGFWKLSADLRSPPAFAWPSTAASLLTLNILLFTTTVPSFWQPWQNWCSPRAFFVFVSFICCAWEWQRIIALCCLILQQKLRDIIPILVTSMQNGEGCSSSAHIPEQFRPLQQEFKKRHWDQITNTAATYSYWHLESIILWPPLLIKRYKFKSSNWDLKGRGFFSTDPMWDYLFPLVIRTQPIFMDIKVCHAVESHASLCIKQSRRVVGWSAEQEASVSTVLLVLLSSLLSCLPEWHLKWH